MKLINRRGEGHQVRRKRQLSKCATQHKQNKLYVEALRRSYHPYSGLWLPVSFRVDLKDVVSHFGNYFDMLQCQISKIDTWTWQKPAHPLCIISPLVLDASSVWASVSQLLIFIRFREVYTPVSVTQHYI